MEIGHYQQASTLMSLFVFHRYLLSRNSIKEILNAGAFLIYFLLFYIIFAVCVII